MTTGYQIKEQDALYYLTLQVVDWVDIFTRQCYRDIVVDSLRYCQLNKNLQVFAFVIMSNHVHLIANSGTSELSTTLRDFKKFTSKGDCFYKLVANTDNRSLSDINSVFYLSKKQLDILRAHPEDIENILGLPLASVAPSYKVHKIECRAEGHFVFKSRVAPTMQAKKAGAATDKIYFTDGGGEQTLILNNTDKEIWKKQGVLEAPIIPKAEPKISRSNK